VTLCIGTVLIVRKGNIEAINHLEAFASSRRYTPMSGTRAPGIWAVVHRVVVGRYEHWRLYATDSRWCDGCRPVSFVNNGRRIGDEELERAFGISIITAEFVKLLIGECIADGISANFRTIYGIPRLFLVFDP
jgi:hypothetical protein